METLNILFENEVDHAGDRVRAIDRRRAAGDDIDAIDECRGNGVDVDFGDLPGIVGDPAPPVDQDQGAHTAEPAQVECRGAGSGVVRRAGEARCQLRKQVESLFDVGNAGHGEVFGPHRLNRARALAVGALYARAGNDNFLWHRWRRESFLLRDGRDCLERRNGAQQRITAWQKRCPHAAPSKSSLRIDQ